MCQAPRRMPIRVRIQPQGMAQARTARVARESPSLPSSPPGPVSRPFRAYQKDGPFLRPCVINHIFEEKSPGIPKVPNDDRLFTAMTTPVLLRLLQRATKVQPSATFLPVMLQADTSFRPDDTGSANLPGRQELSAPGQHRRTPEMPRTGDFP